MDDRHGFDNRYLIVNGKQDAQSTYTNTEEIAREAENVGVKGTYGPYAEGTHEYFNMPYE